MNNQEAIARLQVAIRGKREKIKFNKTFSPKQDNEQLEQDIEVYETAISALEKQIPKKVNDKSTVQDNGIVVGFVGRCPNCNEIIDDTSIVCDCGQHLNWRDID